MTRFFGKAAAAVAIGGLLGAGTAAGIGIASAVSDPTPSATTATSAPTGTEQPRHLGWHPGRGHPGLHRFLFNRVEHGEITVKGRDGKPVVVDVQRGTVTAVSATSITLKSEDGFTATYRVDSDTRVRVGGTRKAIGDVKVGANAGLLAKKEGGTPTAYFVVVR